MVDLYNQSTSKNKDASYALTHLENLLALLEQGMDNFDVKYDVISEIVELLYPHQAYYLPLKSMFGPRMKAELISIEAWKPSKAQRNYLDNGRCPESYFILKINLKKY